jgi:hypothetical protein
MTDTEINSGLVLPYVIQAVAGKGGAAALLITIFMVSQPSRLLDALHLRAPRLSIRVFSGIDES